MFQEWRIFKRLVLWKLKLIEWQINKEFSKIARFLSLTYLFLLENISKSIGVSQVSHYTNNYYPQPQLVQTWVSLSLSVARKLGNKLAVLDKWSLKDNIYIRFRTRNFKLDEMEQTGARPRTCVARNLYVLEEEEEVKKVRKKKLNTSNRPSTASSDLR